MFNSTLTKKPSLRGRQLNFHLDDVRIDQNFGAVDYQNGFRFAGLHKFNATHCRVVFEFSCLVNEFEIPFQLVVSHLAFTLDFHKKTHAAEMNFVAFLNCVYLFINVFIKNAN